MERLKLQASRNQAHKTQNVKEVGVKKFSRTTCIPSKPSLRMLPFQKGFLILTKEHDTKPPVEPSQLGDLVEELLEEEAVPQEDLTVKEDLPTIDDSKVELENKDEDVIQKLVNDVTQDDLKEEVSAEEKHRNVVTENIEAV